MFPLVLYLRELNLQRVIHLPKKKNFPSETQEKYIIKAERKKEGEEKERKYRWVNVKKKYLYDSNKIVN